MLELMNEKALELGAERRREVALDTMRAAHAAAAHRRSAATTGFIAVRAEARSEAKVASQLQPSSDCV